MAKVSKNILLFKSEEVLDFFMKSEQFRGFELPDKKRKKSPYTMRLCQLVVGKCDGPLWNNDWLKQDIYNKLPYESIVNKEILKKVTPVITFREMRAYNENILCSKL